MTRSYGNIITVSRASLNYYELLYLRADLAEKMNPYAS